MREARAEEERTGHESEVKAQGGQEEDVNSVYDESHVSNRHMTWWQNAVAECLVGPSQQRAPPADGERPSKSVASSRKGRAGSARDGKGHWGEKGRNGSKGKRREEKAAPCTLSSTFPLQPLQQPQQPQQQLQRQCACNDAYGDDDQRRKVEYTFIQNRFYPLTLSSKHDFNQ